MHMLAMPSAVQVLCRRPALAQVLLLLQLLHTMQRSAAAAAAAAAAAGRPAWGPRPGSSTVVTKGTMTLNRSSSVGPDNPLPAFFYMGLGVEGASFTYTGPFTGTSLLTVRLVAAGCPALLPPCPAPRRRRPPCAPTSLTHRRSARRCWHLRWHHECRISRDWLECVC